MTLSLRQFYALILFTLLAGVTACSQGNDTNRAETKKQDILTTQKADVQTRKMNLAVFKSPTCGCCVGWINHMQENGFATSVHEPDDLNAIKVKYGIAAENQSCHTAVTPDGDVFEGHVPAKFVRRFLNEKPDGAFGLSVPAMPIGTPGMEMGGKFTPYKIILLKKDGSREVYADIKTAAEQF